jgi:2-succinyl-5-enolpyruvyl-6-hydroxy-3-cyclohexene-1-carboxylate synthase
MKHFKKEGAQLAYLLKAFGVETIITSPGSRNAPLVHSFEITEGLNCETVIDERSAGFVALGIIQATNKPVVLCCTSGSALLNYAPAAAEAFYQKLPLIIISADRPKHLINQADGQTISQENALQQVVKSCFNLLEERDENDQRFNHRLICEALNTASNQPLGPVHINLPLNEPLYSEIETGKQHKAIFEFKNDRLSKDLLSDLAEKINTSTKCLVLVGTQNPNENFQKSVATLSSLEQCIVFYETTSNLCIEEGIGTIDKVLSSCSEEEWSNFQPDLLITLGTNVVSKRIKQQLRKFPAQEHIHIGCEHQLMDTYFCLTHSIQAEAKNILPQLTKLTLSNPSLYQQQWLNKKEQAKKNHSVFCKDLSFSDLWLFQQISAEVPNEYSIHWGNSSVIRYAQLFEHKDGLKHFGNRGVSGIDGCTSTAVGYAFSNEIPTLLISGDVSFLYDSNAFWNKLVSKNLKVIVVNNNGGNIFKIIDGPNRVKNYSERIETKHNSSAEQLCLKEGVTYLSAKNKTEVSSQLTKLFLEEKCTVLEVFTPSDESPEILKNYFKNLT